jgi:hypothetical protein
MPGLIYGGTLAEVMAADAAAAEAASLAGTAGTAFGAGSSALGADAGLDAAANAAGAGSAYPAYEATRAGLSSLAQPGFWDQAGQFADKFKPVGQFIDKHPYISGMLGASAFGLASTFAGRTQAQLMAKRQEQQDAALQSRLAQIKPGPMSQTLMDPMAMYNAYSAPHLQGLGYAGGGIVSLAGGGLAPLPGMAQEIARRRSATAFIRSSYPTLVAAQRDLRNPDSPLLKLGIRSPNDPLLTAAFSGGGGLVDGPGTGTSDGISALIDGAQPAALSQGEHVIPARTVAALGNGSTKAGSQRLHDMVQRINRTAGLPKQPQDINPDEVLPA